MKRDLLLPLAIAAVCAWPLLGPYLSATQAKERKLDITKIYGRIQLVDSFPDYKVQVVNDFSDLKVQKVKSFPDGPGKWQIVDSFPDYKIQLVEAFPDFTIQYVENFPGPGK